MDAALIAQCDAGRTASAHDPRLVLNTVDVNAHHLARARGDQIHVPHVPVLAPMPPTCAGARPQSAVFLDEPLRNAIDPERVSQMGKLTCKVLATCKERIDWRMC